MSQWAVAMVVGAVSLIGAAAFWWTGPHLSIQEHGRLSRACIDWIGEEYADGRAVRLGERYTRRRHVVYEVLIARPSGGGFNIYPCVVEPRGGTMLKPSVLDTRWRR